MSEQKTPTLPLRANGRGPAREAPLWLRPFFSLRAQLICVYGFLFTIVVVLVVVLYYQSVSITSMSIVAVGLIVLGTACAFILTSLLLRPLWRLTDAAQAIALGDLKQRERLELRLPPQDEIDRLAGSLNEMVKQLEHAEEMQRASEQRFRRFFSDASHQLRTPLTSLRGFTEVLLRGAKDDPETAQRILNRMKNEAERMTNLINDLLTLARLDDDRPLKTSYVDLVEVASERLEQARMRAKDGRTLSLVMETKENLGLQADEERLKQLLFILLDNALKYGRLGPEGIVTLQLDRQNGYALIRVIDNGEGIAKDDLAHIFDSFYKGLSRRPSSSNGVSTSGTGLGLSIANAIVRAHHGTISVYSEPDKGTIFTVTLPCLD